MLRTLAHRGMSGPHILWRARPLPKQLGLHDLLLVSVFAHCRLRCRMTHLGHQQQQQSLIGTSPYSIVRNSTGISLIM